MNNELLEKLKKLVIDNYDSDSCGFTEECSQGNDSDVFRDGEDRGRSWLAYEIGCLLDMDLEKPKEQVWSWE